MNKIYQILKKVFSFTMVLCLSGCHRHVMGGILHPKGIIAFQERQLMFDAIALMLIVVIPVIIMSFAFLYRYHQSHDARDHHPNWSHNHFLETIWWGVPCAIVLILGIMTWKMAHKLDPYRKIDVPGKPLIIKVVALPWKWLFIYPEQNIATVNYLELPDNRQIAFRLTSDNVPMSAFFIPQLGSQIYTMAGMRTQLHLLATHQGTFEGLDAQYNGDGFSDMHFKVKVVGENDLNRWFARVKRSSKALTMQNYQTLRQPKIAAPVQYYSSVIPHLFTNIIKSYKKPEHPSDDQGMHEKG